MTTIEHLCDKIVNVNSIKRSQTKRSKQNCNCYFISQCCPHSHKVIASYMSIQLSDTRHYIIQAEKFLNADWLKRALFISNRCHIWEKVVFQGFDFSYLEESSISGLEILLSSKYGNMKVLARQTRWRTILSFSVCKCGHFNGISRRSAQKTRNMESKLLLCGVTELKRGLCCLNISKRSFDDISVRISCDRGKLLE